MFNDIKVGLLSASSSLNRGNKKTTIFIIFVLALIYINLVFLPAMISGVMATFVGYVQDFSYGNIVIEPIEDENYINNVDSVLQKVRAVNGVDSAAKRLNAGASVEYKQEVVGLTITGLVPKDELDVSRYPYIISEGEFIGDLSRDEIILGAMVAGTGPGADIYDNLGEVRPGALVNVTFSNNVERTYKVKGIMKGSVEFTDLNAVMHYKEIEDVYGLKGDEATSVVIRIINEGEEREIRSKIIDAGVNEQVYIWEDKAEALIRQASQSISSIDIVSKFVSLIVGAALILIIIYINVLNRKREIGILRAIGITPSSIRISYVFISLFYICAGILLGLFFYFILIGYLQANPVNFFETLTITPQVDIGLLIQSALIMIGMSLVAGFIPAWFVTRESIIDAIWKR